MWTDVSLFVIRAYKARCAYMKSGALILTYKTIAVWANVGAPVSCGDEPHYAKEKQLYFNRHCQKRLIARSQLHFKEMLCCLSMALLW